MRRPSSLLKLKFQTTVHMSCTHGTRPFQSLKDKTVRLPISFDISLVDFDILIGKRSFNMFRLILGSLQDIVLCKKHGICCGTEHKF